ncbi:MAG: beta-propeller domain-containing protein [Candidatus Aenigmarchaeota archaeon]|nr:beta-propeller domain-containing protein [Candidatus Aenigmarchaeota archaeon]
MKDVFSKLALVLLVLIAIAAFTYVFVFYKAPVSEVEGVKSFSSEQEFKFYLQEASGSTGALSGFLASAGALSARRTLESVATPSALPPLKEGEEIPSRVSTTTVQVMGIDEPDIVKTDGKEIYFSSHGYRRYWWELEIPRYILGETKIIKAFPPENLRVRTKVNKGGDLLLYNKILLIFSGDKIYGLDVSNSESPKEVWTIELNSSVVGARLYNGKIYLITRKDIDYYHPCPIKPLSRNGVPLIIECSRIYHPTKYIPIDVTYNAMILNPGSGEVEKTVSFVGSHDSSVVYMSENAIYVTYSYPEDFFSILYDFLREKCRDIIPSYVIEKLGKIKDYEISSLAKLTELGVVLWQYTSSLSSDERMKLDNELSNRMKDYFAEYKRDLMKTGIAKISLNMEVLGAGSVPGTPLNQFSLDEYQNHLRIATTVGGWGGDSANDVYVLDKDLKIVGSIKDLGLEERIYSVRFLQDKGYVVTFREIDPFYVLDLSNPTKPELKGELKIPGYSSYLHPITKDKILGIGKDGRNVKVALFDVASAENPQEIDKYTLREYWSDILATHHAFLLDDKHEIFFLPGSRGGYVFSYKANKLSLTKAVSGISARRAIYIEDYLYIIGENKIVVLDENSWEKVKEMELS